MRELEDTAIIRAAMGGEGSGGGRRTSARGAVGKMMHEINAIERKP